MNVCIAFGESNVVEIKPWVIEKYFFAILTYSNLTMHRANNNFKLSSIKVLLILPWF